MIEVTSFLRPITITHGLSVLGQACQHHYDNASLLPYHLKIKNRLLITRYLSILPKTPFLLRWILEDEKNCKEKDNIYLKNYQQQTVDCSHGIVHLLIN